MTIDNGSSFRLANITKNFFLSAEAIFFETLQKCSSEQGLSLEIEENAPVTVHSCPDSYTLILLNLFTNDQT